MHPGSSLTDPPFDANAVCTRRNHCVYLEIYKYPMQARCHGQGPAEHENSRLRKSGGMFSANWTKFSPPPPRLHGDLGVTWVSLNVPGRGYPGGQRTRRQQEDSYGTFGAVAASASAWKYGLGRKLVARATRLLGKVSTS